MATKKPIPKGFEKSIRDIERGGMKEGSKKEEAFDRRQAAVKKAPTKKKC